MHTLIRVSGSEGRQHEGASSASFYRELLRQKSAVIGASILSFFIIIAIFAPLIATHDPRNADVTARLEGWSQDHYFGTDKVGRDIFSRIVYGSRISIKVGLVAMTFSISIGALLGIIAGYYGGWLDNSIMRVMDMMLAMPSILLAMVIVTILGTEPDKCDYCCLDCLHPTIC